METVNVAVRMERRTRDDAAKLFSELGIGSTQAINMLLKQGVGEQGIPFEIAAKPVAEHGNEKVSSSSHVRFRLRSPAFRRKKRWPAAREAQERYAARQLAPIRPLIQVAGAQLLYGRRRRCQALFPESPF